jgi:hypothetical protein
MSWSDRFAFLLAATVLAGCSGGGDADKGKGDDDDDDVDPFTQFVDPPGEVSGDFTCFTPATEPTWLAADLDPAKQADWSIEGLVEDFENGTPVVDATVELFTSDEVAGTPDAFATSDVNGRVTLDGPSCTPLTYRVNPVQYPIPTRETFKVHQVYGAPTGDTITDASFVSVSDVTYQLIPGLLNIQIQPGLSIIAGTAYDCARDPSAASDDPVGKIEGAQVVVYDADGNIPETLGVNYFLADFPAADQRATSDDGLWVATNVPPGAVRVELWGRVGGELVQLGATELDAKADSIAIANIFAGYGDGVKGPATCATAR